MNQRDIERLSEYLDGRLNPSDSARLETRIHSDPALASALDALRESRALLRRLPHRRAPRNFTLTPKMVGLKPPLPRAYPVFRFATVVATLLFAFSFLNIRPIPLGASAPAVEYGMGGGDASEMPATEPPMAEMAVATEAPAEPEILPTEMALSLPATTPTPNSVPANDQNRAAEPAQEPAAKSAGDAPPPASPLLTQWQIVLAVIAVLSAASMLLIRQFAARKWRAK